MSCYSKVIKTLGLNADSQAQYGWMYLLLSKLDEYDTASPDVYANPFAETLRRLSNVPGHGVQMLATEFGTRVS